MIDEETARKFAFMPHDQQDRVAQQLKGLGVLGADGLPDPAKLKQLLNRIKPVTSEEYLKDPAGVPVDEEGGLLIKPEPGFVLKTKELRTHVKFFINMVHHPVIDKPEAKEMVDLDVGRSYEEPTRSQDSDVCGQHPRRF